MFLLKEKLQIHSRERVHIPEKIVFNHTLGENMLVPSKHTPLFSAKPIKNCQPKKNKERHGGFHNFSIQTCPLPSFSEWFNLQHSSKNPSNWRATARHGSWYPDSRDVCCQSPKRRATAAFLPKWRKSSSHLLFCPGPRRKPRNRVLGSWVFFPQFLRAASCKKL